MRTLHTLPQVASGQEHLASMQQAADRSVEELSGLLSGAVTGARERSLEYSVHAVAGLQATQEQATATIQALVDGLAGQTTQLQGFASRQAEGMHASLGALQVISSSAQGHLTGVCAFARGILRDALLGTVQLKSGGPLPGAVG